MPRCLGVVQVSQSSIDPGELTASRAATGQKTYFLLDSALASPQRGHSKMPKEKMTLVELPFRLASLRHDPIQRFRLRKISGIEGSFVGVPPLAASRHGYLRRMRLSPFAQRLSTLDTQCSLSVEHHHLSGPA